MKLARADLFLVRHEAPGRLAPRYRLPPSGGVRRAVRPAPRRLVAHWHVCPQTQRLECSWSLVVTPEGQLCRLRTRKRLVRARRLFHTLKGRGAAELARGLRAA